MVSSLQRNSSDNMAARLWHLFIEDYSNRKLTLQKDKLPALSGIISALEAITGDVCHAGLWQKHFLRGLLWCSSSGSEGCEVPGIWRAPSWSFAAVDSPIKYPVWHDADICSQFNSCSVIPVGQNPLGELKDGTASITAPVFQLEDITYDQTQDSGGVGRAHGQTERKLHVHFDLAESSTCLILLITLRSGIAIRASATNNDMYSRIGFADTHGPLLFSRSQLPPSRTIILV
jgi:hypothetical protein